MQYICIYLLYSLNIIYIPYIIYKLINICMKYWRKSWEHCRLWSVKATERLSMTSIDIGLQLEIFGILFPPAENL